MSILLERTAMLIGDLTWVVSLLAFRLCGSGGAGHSVCDFSINLAIRDLYGDNFIFEINS